jgi:hypothetical protein
MRNLTYSTNTDISALVQFVMKLPTESIVKICKEIEGVEIPENVEGEKLRATILVGMEKAMQTLEKKARVLSYLEVEEHRR